jgi:hypothetical protein
MKSVRYASIPYKNEELPAEKYDLLICWILEVRKWLYPESTIDLRFQKTIHHRELNSPVVAVEINKRGK